MRVLVVAVFLVGCAGDGRPLRAWTLDADGTHVALTLPSSLFAQLGVADTDYTLRTTIALGEHERGKQLTLAVAYSRIPMALTVAGERVDDRGDASVGEHRFVFDAGDRMSLDLVIAAHHPVGAPAFEVAPTLEVGDIGTGAIALFNRYSNLVALFVAAVVAFLYGVLWVLDPRRRPEYAWVAAASAASVEIALSQLGVLGGAIGFVALTVCATVTFLGVIAIAHAVFDWGRAPRALRIPLAVYTGWPIAYALSPRFGVVLGGVCIAVPVLIYVYLTIRLARVVRDHGTDAWFLLAAYVFAVFANAVETITALSGINPLSGIHLIGTAMIALLLGQLVVLGRQHVTRTHALDKAADELARQVAARSKDLGDALAQLAAKPRAELETAAVIDGRYRVVKKLGSGGMGSVHEVERISDGERFALKRIRGQADAAVLARFAREAQIAAELRHPNLVPVIDVGVADGELFLVMPIVDGGSLVAARAQYGDAVWARKILREIAIGLAALHERSIVHRDLKPGNILVAGGVARIADFGLAYFAEMPRGHDTALASTMTGLNPVTRIGDVFGTPPYMAPELIKGVHAAGPETDVFSFGVIAFELTTGKFPFREPPLVAAMAGRSPVAADTASIDPALRPIIERCLAFEAAKRPTARELVDLLA